MMRSRAHSTGGGGDPASQAAARSLPTRAALLLRERMDFAGILKRACESIPSVRIESAETEGSARHVYYLAPAILTSPADMQRLKQAIETLRDGTDVRFRQAGVESITALVGSRPQSTLAIVVPVHLVAHTVDRATALMFAQLLGIVGLLLVMAFVAFAIFGPDARPDHDPTDTSARGY
jgi:hypothetical protein